MAKSYFMRFGAGDPRGFTGLAPTLIIFKDPGGSNIAAPTISEVPTATGLYTFSYGATTPIVFLADGFTTSLGAGRYVTGAIDPSDRADEYGNTLIAYGLSNLAFGQSNVALGISNFALGTSGVAQGLSNFIGIATANSALALLGPGLTGLAGLIGDTASSYGTDLVDPTTIFGFLRRSQEFWEGNEVYTKTSGLLDFYPRGASQLLREKTISDTVLSTTKT